MSEVLCCFLSLSLFLSSWRDGLMGLISEVLVLDFCSGLI
jgi:hypothetical protein